jgi:hypothetical protein
MDDASLLMNVCNAQLALIRELQKLAECVTEAIEDAESE